MDREEYKIEALKRIMNTLDGRDFLYMFFSDSCGVDFLSGVPSTFKDEYTAGVRKPAIDIMNLMIYHCHSQFEKMLDEQKLRIERDKHGN